MSNLFKSRKFWATLTALVVAVFGNRAGLGEVEIAAAVSSLVAYILGVGLEGIRPQG